jgi:tetratricopeptide (TPR) repeat protein
MTLLEMRRAARRAALVLLFGQCVLAGDGKDRKRDLLGQAVVAARPDVKIYRNASTTARTDCLFFGQAPVIDQAFGQWIEISDGWLRIADVVLQRDALTYFDSNTDIRPPAFVHASRALCLHLLRENAQADDEAEAARKIDPHSPYALFTLGVLCSSRDDSDGAVRFFSQVVELEPSLVDAYRRRGFGYFAKGDYEMAERDLALAARKYPQSAETKALRALARLGKDPQCKNDGERAVDDLETLFRAVPSNEIAGAYSTGLLRRCVARSQRGQLDAALLDADVAVRVRASRDAFMKRGMCYYFHKNFSKSADDHASAVRLDPSSADCHFGLGLALYAKGDERAASISLTKAILLGCTEPAAYFFRGEATRQDDPRAAIIDFDTVLKLNPQYALAYHCRAFAYQQLSEHENAIADFDRLIEGDATLDEAWLGRARSLVALRRFAEAITDCDKVVDLMSGKSGDGGRKMEAIRLRADALTATCKYAATIKDLDYLLLRQPANAELYFERAGLWRILGERTKALNDLTESISLAPSAESYRQRASLLELLGRSLQASVDRAEASRLDFEMSKQRNESESD